MIIKKALNRLLIVPSQIRGPAKLLFLPYFIARLLTARKFMLFPAVEMRLQGKKFFCRANSSDWFHLTTDYEADVMGEAGGVRGKVFLDIGTHIGRYSILLAKNFRRVVSFEPFPETFEILKRNIAANGLRNITPVNLALGERSGAARMETVSENFGGNHLDKGGAVGVRMSTLDRECGRLGVRPEDVALVKIDVEGAEMRVLAGAKRFLKRTRATIVIESFGKNSAAVRKILLKNGFSLKRRLSLDNYVYNKS